MAVIRELSLYNQQRVDVPHLRYIESGVCGDFDLLAGRILGGKKPLIVNGFTITVTSSIIGNPATSLVLNTAGAQLIHFYASENGSMFFVPSDQESETLSTTNSKIVGSFSASATNYIGIDLIKQQDTTTNDSLQFIDPTTDTEISKIVPTARTLDYKIYIQTTPFSAASNVAPVAIVITDGSNNVTSVEDARSLMFRLGSGGDVPSASNKFNWSTRAENPITSSDGVQDPFSGGDKQLTSLKDWIDAVNSRLWEIGGGEYWYSQTSDKNVRLVFAEPTSPMTDNVEFDGTNIRWSGLSLAFNNSAAIINTITDHTTYDVAIANNQCLYADVNRATNNSTLDIHTNIASLSSLGDGIIPGSRIIIAWRIAGKVYVRNKEYWAGKTLALMTPSSTGVAYALTDASNATVATGIFSNPVVPLTQSNGQTLTTGVTLGSSGSALYALSGGQLLIGGSGGDQSVTIQSKFSTLAGASINLDSSVTGTATIKGTAATASASPDIIIQSSNSNRAANGATLEIRNSANSPKIQFYDDGTIKRTTKTWDKTFTARELISSSSNTINCTVAYVGLTPNPTFQLGYWGVLGTSSNWSALLDTQIRLPSDSTLNSIKVLVEGIVGSNVSIAADGNVLGYNSSSPGFYIQTNFCTPSHSSTVVTGSSAQWVQLFPNASDVTTPLISGTNSSFVTLQLSVSSPTTATSINIVGFTINYSTNYLNPDI